MRLIDADALYKAMQDAEELARRRVLDTESTLPYPTNLNPAYTRYLAQMDERIRARRMVESAPTVDAVPVVRCGECRYWDRSPSCSATPQYHACRRRIMGNVHTMREDFCSQGERKEDGGEHG